MSIKSVFSFLKQLHFQKIYLLLLVSSVITANVPVYANESKLMEAPIFIDGKPIKTRYIMREGHLLVPALFIKNTGASVDWNDDYRSVIFKAKNMMFALPLGKKYSDDFDSATSKWKRASLSVETLDFGGEPFVPLLDVVKKLGMTARYDRELARTFITTNIEIEPNTIRKADTTQKLVALTFDDGPEAFYTPQILDILKEKTVPATFFVVGKQIYKFPSMMERIVNEGHAIANHTNHHPDLRYQYSSKVKEEIQATQLEMEKVVGKKPDLFRPPYGAITKADIMILNQLGMKNILWSVDTLDWSGLSAESILEIVHREIEPGAIILQHNFQSNAPLLDGTIEALPKMIDDLKKQGYKFVTLQTLFTLEKEEKLRKEQLIEDEPIQKEPTEEYRKIDFLKNNNGVNNWNLLELMYK